MGSVEHSACPPARSVEQQKIEKSRGTEGYQASRLLSLLENRRNHKFLGQIQLRYLFSATFGGKGVYIENGLFTVQRGNKYMQSSTCLR